MPIDVSAEKRRDFVEECPACGSPMVLHTDIEQDGRARVDCQSRVFSLPAMKKKSKKKRRPSGRSPHAEATYTCDSCGEEIVVPVDISAGTHQDYVEDCPVCCHPMTLHVDIDPDGEAHVEGEHE